MAYYQSKPTSGRHFLQIPGPSNTPDRVLRAMDNPTMDHRGPDFGKFGKQLLEKLRGVFKTSQPVIVFPASGTGAWEAALANTLSPGDRVLMCETGWFAHLWQELAGKLGLKPELIETDWRRGADVAAIEAALREDKAHAIKAVCVVHNETSTGATSRIGAVRQAIDAAGHPGAAAGRYHQRPRLDRLPARRMGRRCHHRRQPEGADAAARPVLQRDFSQKALQAAEGAKTPRSYWDWRPMLAANEQGYFPSTPATNLLYGLDAAIDMLLEEGLDNVFARHDRFAEATRRAVRAWGLEVQVTVPGEYSSVLTAVRLPEGHSANALRATILEKFNMSLGNGLGRLNDRVFRIGHLGDFGPLQLVGTLGGVEMGLGAAGVPHKAGGVQAAMAYLNGNA